MIREYRSTPFIAICAAALIVFGGAVRVVAGQISWTGAVDAEWDTPGNWNPAQVPTLADDVTVGGAVHCSSNLYAKSLSISSAGTVRFHSTTDTAPSSSISNARGDGSFTFQVADDLVCAGGKLCINGRGTSITNLQISIGGNLVLSGAASMCVAAATFDGADVSPASLYRQATRVNIGGAFIITNTATLYPVADEKVGTAVRFSAASFLLDANAVVHAEERGWYWLPTPRDPRCTNIDDRSKYTFGLGYGNDSGPRVGAGHGGAGSEANATYGKTYGYSYAPFLPGSPGGGDSNWRITYNNTAGCGRGGGVFWLVVSGAAAIYGKVQAYPLVTGWQASSGGSIWIAADSFDFGANAKLDAHGASYGSSTPTAAGGGGRVSLAQGLTEAELDALARGETPSGLLYADTITSLDVDVAGGTLKAGGTAGVGTATFVSSAATIRMVTVAGNPVTTLNVTPDYGDYPTPKGDDVSFSAEEYGMCISNATWRYRCLGYVVSNGTEAVASGPGRSYSTTVADTPIVMIWQWDETEYESWLKITGPGTISASGTPYATDTSIWFKASQELRLVATPASGAEFLYWCGDISENQRFSAELVLPAEEQHHLTAIFRTTGQAGTYTWINGGTGNFTDGANWDAGTPPGRADTAIVPTGTCKLPEFVRLGSLSVTAGGTVTAARTAAAAGYKTVRLSVSGDTTISGSGSITLGPADGSGTVYNMLDVGGNLVLSNSATLRVGAGRRTGAYTWNTGCGFVDVGGAFRLLDSSVFKPNCDGYYGGGVKTTVGGRFHVGTAASVNATGLGMGEYRSLGWATGVGTSGTTAAGHGGAGQNGGNGNGDTYDYAYAPHMPGQQNREASVAPITRGGGLVRIHAGSVSIDGSIVADGQNCSGGCSSGGSIWLTSSGRLSVSREAQISAKGGSSTVASYGSGGGGRVAFGERVTAEQLAALTANPSVLPAGLENVTTEKLAALPNLESAAAPGDTALEVAKCWGTVRWLRNPSIPPTVLMVK